MKYFISIFLLLIGFINAARQERRLESEEIEIIIVEEKQPEKVLVHRGLVPQLWPNYTK